MQKSARFMLFEFNLACFLLRRIRIYFYIKPCTLIRVRACLTTKPEQKMQVS